MKRTLAALLALIVSVCLAQSTGINGGGPNGGGGGTVPSGGTGRTTLTAHGVLVGEGTSPINSVAPMVVDTLLQGQGVTLDPAAVALVNCGDATHALAYSTGTHTFSCQALISGGTPGGSTTQVQFNLTGAFAGDVGFTYTGSTTQTIGLGTGATGPTINAVTSTGTGRTFAINGSAGAVGNDGGPLNISAGAAGSGAVNGGALSLTGGSTTSGIGGGVSISGGSPSTGTGGAVTIKSGGTTTLNSGSVIIQTAGTTRLTVAPAGSSTFTSSMVSGGTTFTASGCANSTLIGGAIAGQFTSGTTGTCTVAITLPTAPHGWACHASDLTTPANFIGQSAQTTTSCTVQGTTVTNDIIVFSALAF